MTHDTYCKEHGENQVKFIRDEDNLELTIYRECDKQEKTYQCGYDDCEQNAFYYIAYSRGAN